MRVEEERMKESGINKLIELLNQFEKEKKSGFIWRSIDSYDNCVYGVDCDGETEITMYSDLYSKQYGFIQRLVKHFMFNMTKIDARIALSDFNATDRMLMALAISYNPIELLIDCLK